MSLKDKLFPQENNDTGSKDQWGFPILVGSLIKDDGGNIVQVFKTDKGFVVSDGNEANAYSMSLKLWILGSDYVEIVVQKPVQNEAEVALAPFRDIKKAAKKTRRSY